MLYPVLDQIELSMLMQSTKKKSSQWKFYPIIILLWFNNKLKNYSYQVELTFVAGIFLAAWPLLFVSSAKKITSCDGLFTICFLHVWEIYKTMFTL